MIKKSLIACIGLILLLGGLYWIKQSQKSASAPQPGNGPPPVSVTTAVVQERLLEPTIDAIGSLAAVHGVTLSSEVPGMVSAIHFQSSQSVRKGDVLIELDAESEQAQLAAAEAQTRLAKIRFDRAEKLRSKSTIAQSELDTAEAELTDAQARARNLRSLISKKRIRAPFDGQLGIRKVENGQYLSPGAEIVSLQSLEKIHVDFTIPQQQISNLEMGMVVRITTDVFPSETFTGTLTAIAPEVSETTRSISLQATVDNADKRLLPGMFVRAHLLIKEEAPSLILPTTAVQYAPFGDSVFLVEEKEGQQLVIQKFITISATHGDFVSIEDGLELGDVIVSTGGFKLRNGASISAKNDFSPDAEIAPNPSDS